jgi:hypothetical protein
MNPLFLSKQLLTTEAPGWSKVPGHVSQALQLAVPRRVRQQPNPRRCYFGGPSSRHCTRYSDCPDHGLAE